MNSARCIVFVYCFGALLRGQSSVPKTRAVLPTSRASLTASPGRKEFSLGSKIYLTLKIKNTSQQVVRISQSVPEYDYRVVLTDSNGKEAERTKQGFALENPGKEIGRTEDGGIIVASSPISFTRLELQPGEEVEVELNLSTLFNFTKPGTYYLRVRRELQQELPAVVKDTDEIVFSNPVELTIVP